MKILSFGASVVGPGHLRDGRPNQDAWGHASVSGGRVIVVADGMGSKPHAELGSAAAVAAVVQSLRIWNCHADASTDVLLGLIHMLWQAKLGPIAIQDAATTCLFAFLRDDGSGWVGQMGDGLALIIEDGRVRTLGGRDPEAFANQTNALGVTRALGAWTLEPLNPGANTVLLCTDGVADDLLEPKIPAFYQWVNEELAPLPARVRWQRLARELREWPTPHHTDDKTLAFIRSAA